MNLNELNDLLQKVRVLETAVEEVKSRIINHRSDYDSNENATRYGLIDPILDALDWDVRDVGMVRTEYRMTSGPVDYALFDGTAPLAVVEAKRLSRTLDASVSVQLLSYAIDVESIPIRGCDERRHLADACARSTRHCIRRKVVERKLRGVCA